MQDTPSKFNFSQLPPPMRRLVIASLILFFGWLFFLQIVPRTMMQFTPPLPSALAPQPQTQTPEEKAPEPPAPEEEAALPEIPAAAPDESPAAPEPETKDEAEETAESARAGQLEQLQALEEKINALSPPAEKPDAPSATPDVLGQQAAIRMLDERLSAQGRTIESLREEQRRILRRLTLADLFDRLKERVLTGKPFAEPLAALQVEAAADGNAALSAALKPLGPAAPAGIPSLQMLQAEFGAAARRALHPAPGAQAGFTGHLRANLSKLITIRRVGAVQESGPEAVLARAETALNAGDVEAALATLAALSEPQREAMQPWLKSAGAYAAREALLADVKRAVFSVPESAHEPVP